MIARSAHGISPKERTSASACSPPDDGRYLVAQDADDPGHQQGPQVCRSLRVEEALEVIRGCATRASWRPIGNPSQLPTADMPNLAFAWIRVRLVA
jgi:hypothetical protein